MHAAPGDVDPSFDAGRGATNIRPGTGDGVLSQPDGRIIVGGHFNGIGVTNVPPIVRNKRRFFRRDPDRAASVAFEPR